MIDKLTIASNDMDLESLKRAFGQTITAKPVNNLYDLCQRVSTLNGCHLFTAYSEPRNSNQLPFRLELNPSRLGLSFIGMISKLEQAMVISDAIVQRIDHAVDYEISVLKAYESVRVKYKRNVKVYADYQAGMLTGFNIGSRLENFVIYNKSFEARGKKFKLIKDSDSLSPLTRFENRHVGSKVPFRPLNQLPCLLGFNPYSSLEFLDLKDPGGFQEFRKKNSLHGMQNSYLQLNKQNNFKRTHAKHFEVSQLSQILASIYMHNLGQFFGEVPSSSVLKGIA